MSMKTIAKKLTASATCGPADITREECAEMIALIVASHAYIETPRGSDAEWDATLAIGEALGDYDGEDA